MVQFSFPSIILNIGADIAGMGGRWKPITSVLFFTIAGDMAYLLFAVGIIGTGPIAIPALSESLSYIVSEASDWEPGLDKKFHEAKPSIT